MSPDTIVLVTMNPTDEQKKAIEAVMPGAHYTYVKYDVLTRDVVQNADIILGGAPPEMVRGSQRLKWMQLTFAGNEPYHVPGVFPENAVLTCASGAYGLAISEHMLGMLLSIIKKLHIYRDNQGKRLWRSEGQVTSIYGSTTLIIGLGDIGGEFAKRVKSLSGYVIGVRRANTDKPDFVDELYLADDLDELLPRADFIALCLPHTESTQRILSKKRIKSLKKSAVIVNIGRGSAIDTEALCDALYNGDIGGAALDVTDPEPLPAEHRLWSAPNAFITPHISGWTHLRQTYINIFDLTLYNFKAFATGGTMKSVVDFKRGY